MSTIIEATLPAEQFALAETMCRLPETTFELVRFVSHGSDRVMPFLWAKNDETDQLPAVIEADASTTDTTVLSELDDGYLFDVEWTASARIAAYVLLEEGATIVDAVAKDGLWRFRLLFPCRESVSATYDLCEANGLDVSIRRLSELSDSFHRGLFGLTREQYQTMVEAHAAGYYEVPRQIDLTDLAGSHEVSHQALSERLRRGHQTLISNALFSEMV
ncbi:bacterio-opsin activator domain-containing protein [Haloarchaeobius sp. DFWS5]|uniref:helix-turn-helix domain-containing protein n=1 Tax=Haloarchaeobius sp. DFWS5 TaxID=3446114 RepID=UPI003EBFA5AE